MRDLAEKKFHRALVGMGFSVAMSVTADGLCFVAHDGVRVFPVLHPGTVRVDRRRTLSRMSTARKRQPLNPAKSEATGVGAPMASMTAAPSIGA